MPCLPFPSNLDRVYPNPAHCPLPIAYCPFRTSTIDCSSPTSALHGRPVRTRDPVMERGPLVFETVRPPTRLAAPPRHPSSHAPIRAGRSTHPSCRAVIPFCTTAASARCYKLISALAAVRPTPTACRNPPQRSSSDAHRMYPPACVRPHRPRIGLGRGWTDAWTAPLAARDAADLSRGRTVMALQLIDRGRLSCSTKPS
jgi:hypothetical protein